MSATRDRILSVLAQIEAAVRSGAPIVVDVIVIEGVGPRVAWGVDAGRVIYSYENARKFADAMDTPEARAWAGEEVAANLRLAAGACQAWEAQLQ